MSASNKYTAQTSRASQSSQPALASDQATLQVNLKAIPACQPCRADHPLSSAPAASPAESAAGGGIGLHMPQATGWVPLTASLALLGAWQVVWRTSRVLPSIVLIPNLAPPG